MIRLGSQRKPVTAVFQKVPRSRDPDLAVFFSNAAIAGLPRARYFFKYRGCGKIPGTRYYNQNHKYFNLILVQDLFLEIVKLCKALLDPVTSNGPSVHCLHI